MRYRRGGEENGERQAETVEPGKRERDPTHAGADEVAELESRGSEAHDREAPIRCGGEPERASGERAPTREEGKHARG